MLTAPVSAIRIVVKFCKPLPTFGPVMQYCCCQASSGYSQSSKPSKPPVNRVQQQYVTAAVAIDHAAFDPALGTQEFAVTRHDIS